MRADDDDEGDEGDTADLTNFNQADISATTRSSPNPTSYAPATGSDRADLGSDFISPDSNTALQ